MQGRSTLSTAEIAYSGIQFLRDVKKCFRWTTPKFGWSFKFPEFHFGMPDYLLTITPSTGTILLAVISIQSTIDEICIIELAVSLVLPWPLGDSQHPSRTAMHSPTAADDILAALPHLYRGPGGSAAIIKDGQVLAKRSWGYANLDHRAPMTPETILPICSISK